MEDDGIISHSSIRAVKRDKMNTVAAPAASHPCRDAQKKEPSSSHPLFMKTVCHIHELVAHKDGPDPYCLETQSHVHALGTTMIPNDSALL